MAAAEEARRSSRSTLTLLAVTVLTSIDSRALTEIGVSAAPEEQVATLARLAQKAGIAGLVCSPLEISLLRREIGSDTVLVTPGIRPSTNPADDQKRTMTPREAAEAGANYIVVGRPILRASDPREAARSITAAIS